MPQRPNQIAQFWQELKRRRVVHVITVYASASFVLIELVNNLTEPLNLPPRLSSIVVLILAVGFPLAVILAWIYDLTPEGIEKTRPIDDDEGSATTRVPNAWRIATYVSFVLIAGLLTLNIVGGSRALRAGDDQLDYFVDGMHANAYKDMNVDAVIEGSVMCLGDSICSQFRLIHTSGEEKQIWNADYTDAKSQILNVYSRVIKKIAQKVKIELTLEENRNLSQTREIKPEAYEAHLMMILSRFDEATEQANMALELNPLRPLVLGLYGAIMISMDDDLEAHRARAEKALSIEPTNAMAKGYLWTIFVKSGESENWFEMMKEASPWDDEVLASIEIVFQKEGFLAAVEAIIKVNEQVQENGGKISGYNQAQRYLTIGRYDRAMDYFEQAYEMHNPNLPYICLYSLEYPSLKDNPRYQQLCEKMNLPQPKK